MSFFTVLLLYIGVSSADVVVKEVTTFISYVLPPMLCYFIIAVLSITPRTHTIRVALCPVMVLLALRAAVPVDMSLNNTERKFHNSLAGWLFATTIRTLDWAFARKLLVRQVRPADGVPSTLLDSVDLVSNFRGYGWNWSRGVHIPRETRPAKRNKFVVHTILSAAVHTFVYGISHTAIRSFSPADLGTLTRGPVVDETVPFFRRAIRLCFPTGFKDISAGSIFDETLPFYLRFFRASVISLLALVWSYSRLQMSYDACTILAVLVLQQNPAQWPPFFDSPWRSTSLTDFWGRRWHQFHRRIFLLIGGYPLSFIFGRAGIVIGSFLASAVYHYIWLITLNSKSGFWRMLVGFGMMAPGIIIEHVFKHITKKKVQGVIGWLWTMGWILLWGNVMVDGFVMAGWYEFPTWVDLVLPLRVLVECLVVKFDTLLHAIS